VQKPSTASTPPAVVTRTVNAALESAFPESLGRASHAVQSPASDGDGVVDGLVPVEPDSGLGVTIGRMRRLGVAGVVGGGRCRVVGV